MNENRNWKKALTAVVDGIGQPLVAVFVSLFLGAIVIAICGENVFTAYGAMIRGAFGNRLTFDLATVNDESTFSGRLCVVTMLFEASGHTTADSSAGGVIGGRPAKRNKGVLGVGPTGRGRFNNAEPTIWNGEDLDIPTFIRHNINLDF